MLENLYIFLKESGHNIEAEALFSLMKKGSAEYKIKPGDNAYKLSKGDPRYQKLIEEANPGLKWKKLQIGQVINLPAPPVYPNANATFSDAATQLIKKYESLRLKSYRIKNESKLTIGYGHQHSGPAQTITEQEALRFLREDMLEALDFIKKNIKVKLSQGQVDALCSIIFNTGRGTFAGSELHKLVNQGRMAEAAEKIKTSFISHPGHVDRRAAESAMFKG